MTLTCFSFGLFTLAFALHWVWWRIRIPRRQTAVLLGIFFGTLVVGIVLASTIPAMAAWKPRGVWEILHVVLFHTAFSLAYVIAYSALEERSPSMTLLVAVADVEPRGLVEADLLAILSGMGPLESRLTAMVRDHMLVFDGTTYHLTAKGSLWAGILGGWRRLVGLPKGG